jgi:SAM-dependent methyltransferase
MNKLIKIKKHLNLTTLLEIMRRGISIGYCPVCEKNTFFFKRGNWWRDHYHCLRCFSIPRQRAICQVLQDYAPNWRELHIHESSPNGPTFDKFLSNCRGYVATQFFPNIISGTLYRGFRCEDLARQTFDDESFDIVITQDVMEHLLEPVESFKEICRTLRPGGMHIFTVPWYYWKKTKIRVKLKGSKIVFIEQPEYHNSPIDNNGSLVVTDFGYDLMDIIQICSGMTTSAIRIHDKRKGIEAKFNEIFISKKPLKFVELPINPWRVQ